MMRNREMLLSAVIFFLAVSFSAGVLSAACNVATTVGLGQTDMCNSFSVTLTSVTSSGSAGLTSYFNGNMVQSFNAIVPNSLTSYYAGQYLTINLLQTDYASWVMIDLIMPSTTTTSTSTSSTTSLSSSTTTSTTTILPFIIQNVWAVPTNSYFTQGSPILIEFRVSGGLAPYSFNIIILNASAGYPIYSGFESGLSSTTFYNQFTLPVEAIDKGNMVIIGNVFSSDSQRASAYNTFLVTAVSTTTSTTTTTKVVTASSTSTTSSSTTTIPYYYVSIWASTLPNSGPRLSPFIGSQSINIFGETYPTASYNSVNIAINSPNGGLILSVNTFTNRYGQFNTSLIGGGGGWVNGTYTSTAVLYLPSLNTFIGTNTFQWYSMPSTHTTSSSTTTIPFTNNGVSTTSTTTRTSSTSSTILPTITANTITISSTTTRTSSSSTTTVVVLTIAQNTTYPSSLPTTNTISVNSIPQGVNLNVSASIGVSITGTANSIPTAINSLSVTFGCTGCNSTNNSTSPNSGVVGFSGSGTITATSQSVAQNTTLFNQLIQNYTPTGYAPEPNTSSITQSSATASSAEWTAIGTESNTTVDISALKNVNVSPESSEIFSVPIAERASVLFIKSAFNNTNIVNKTTTQIMYVQASISKNKTVTRYTPINITTYKSVDAAVISVSNMPSGVDNHVKIGRSTLPIKAISFSVKSNFTTSAISMQFYSGSAISVSGRPVPKPPANAVTAYFLVNSTIGDVNVNQVNYTFNVTQSWFNQHRISPLNMSLYRFNVSTQTWTRLKTVLIGANSTSYVYSASSPGMSFYAMAASPFNITTANSAITIVPQNYGSYNQTNSTSEQTSPAEFSRFVLLMVVSLVVIFVILFLYLRPPFKTNPTPQKEDHSAVDYS